MAQAQPHMGGQKPMGRPSRGAPGPEGTDPRGGVAAPREAAPRKGDQPKGSGQRTHLAPKTHRDGAGAQNTPGKGGRNGTTPEGVNGQTGHGGPPDSLGKGTGEAGASPSFQWMAHIPDRLVRRLKWRATEDAPPQKEIIVLLYAGKDDPGSLDNTLHLMRPSLSPRVLAFDKVREGGDRNQNLLRDEPYNTLCTLAAAGNLRAIVGGPNCRTWSILRWFPKPGRPPPVRGRSELEVWGLEGNTEEIQADTDDDSILLLRQMYLTSLAKEAATKGKARAPTAPQPDPMFYFLEHPQDPAVGSNSPVAHRCSTIWKTRAMQGWLRHLGGRTLSFDQCTFGQVVRKSTTVATNLPLGHWEERRCTHGEHAKPEGMDSAELSRYPEQMQRELAEAILEICPETEQGSARTGTEAPVTPRAQTRKRPADKSPEKHIPEARSKARAVGPRGTQSLLKTGAILAHLGQATAYGVGPPEDRNQIVPGVLRQTLDQETMLLQTAFRCRILRDGGGKPSLGRVAPHARHSNPLEWVGDFILRKAHPLTQVLQRSLGEGAKQHPFSETTLEEIRATIMTPLQNSTVAPGQPFHLHLIGHLAKMAGDPDWQFPLDAAEGVPLGVSEPTWRSPGVWPTKDELTGMEFDPEDLETPRGHPNYPSAEEFAENIKETFREEAKLDMVLGPYSKGEAASTCRCAPEELCPGPMAAIDEGDKVRTIYDGSKGGANAHIQAHTREKTTAPTVLDGVQALHWLHHASATPGDVQPGPGKGTRWTAGSWHWPQPGAEWTLLKADVTKAHRRIKVLPEDWKYQVAEIDGEWWINKVGTYGMASAQLYWGRMAALLLRILYYAFPWLDWGFVFVDDFLWLLRREEAPLQATAILLLLLAMGTPLSWKKTVLSLSNIWLGFQVDPKGPVITMARDKHLIIQDLLNRLVKGEVFSSKAIEKALGRLQWATSSCPMTRVFLQPFWAWKQACKTAGRPPKLVRVLAALLQLLWGKRYTQFSPFTPVSRWWGASDASASEDGEAYIGGWISDQETPAKSEVRWFHVRVEESWAPWAFKGGSSMKRIAALELFGTLLLIRSLTRHKETEDSRVILPLVSDNQGNVYSLLKEAAKKPITAVIAMEILLHTYIHQVGLAPHHVKRDYNQWADELTHPTFTGFSTALRLDERGLMEGLRLVPALSSEHLVFTHALCGAEGEAGQHALSV